MILRLLFLALAQIVVVDLGTIANVATALTVLVGVVFGLVEMRRSRRDREERAAFAAVQAFMTPEWMSSSMIVHSIPKAQPPRNSRTIRACSEACLKIATIMEGIGYSVYARIVAAVRRGGFDRWNRADRVAEFSPVCRVGTYACAARKKLGVVPMAGGTTRTPQCDQDEFGRWVHKPFTATGSA